MPTVRAFSVSKLSSRTFSNGVSTSSKLSTLATTIRSLLETPSPDSKPSVTARGWVRSIRRQKSVAFITVNDGSTVKSLQIVASPDATRGVSLGSAISCTGTLEQSPGANQSVELQAADIRIIGDSPDTYPLQKKSQNAEHLRRYPHLRARTSQGVAMARLRDTVTNALHEAYRNDGFMFVQPPILTANDCEGAGEAFRITTDDALRELGKPQPDASPSASSPSHPEFFDRPTYLTVSTQLHLEAMASSLGRVYTLSPVFRAEPSQTHRHAAEFSMLEAELAFCENVHDVTGQLETALKRALSRIATEAREELDVFSDMQFKYGGHPFEAGSKTITPADIAPLPLDPTSLDTTLNKPWGRISYRDAVKELEAHVAANPGRAVFDYAVGSGLSLQSEHEKWLAATVFGGSPVFVTDYPAAIKPFYMRSNSPSNDVPEAGDTVACFDLLVPRIGELAGGSVREERYERLVEAMRRKNVPVEGMEWYLDLRRYGSVPHGGFGLGFERFISWITGFENIRDCMPFPRTAGKIQL